MPAKVLGGDKGYHFVDCSYETARLERPNQVLRGDICDRGHHSLTPGNPGKRKPTPFSPQTLASVLTRFSPEESELLPNALVSVIIAARMEQHCAVRRVAGPDHVVRLRARGNPVLP